MKIFTPYLHYLNSYMLISYLSGTWLEWRRKCIYWLY